MDSKIANVENYGLMNVEHSDILSVQVLNSFYSYLDVSAVTLKAYRAGIRQFMAYLNISNVQTPKRENVVMFKQALLAAGRKASTVALYLAALRRFFDWCETTGLYPNITRGVKSPKQERGHKRDALSGAQLKECLLGMTRKGEQGLRDKAIFLLMATCGLRTIEVTRANVGDIHEVQGEPVLFVQGKGRCDKKEFVKLSEPVMAAIREYLEARGQVSEEAPLFASCSRRNSGGRLTTRTVSSVAKSAMVSAGYNSRRLTAHSLRHSAATLAIQAGMTLQDVQSFMRHSSISVTTIYLHDVNRLKSQCENAITAAIFAA